MKRAQRQAVLAAIARREWLLQMLALGAAGWDYQQFYRWDFWLRPVGNGPYRYLRYQPGTMVELEANPDYYKGKPKIERVVLKFTRGASLTELLSGNVDAIHVNDSAQLLAIANDPRLQIYWTLANGGTSEPERPGTVRATARVAWRWTRQLTP